MAEDDAQRYLCSYCNCDITLRLKCAVCTDFDLCLQCFAAGATIGTHKNHHPYQLIDEGSFPLMVENWGAIEEVLLLDAVEQDGFGNWEDIAAHVVTKSARECKEHYNEIYVKGVIGQGCIPSDHHASVLEGHGGEASPAKPDFTPVKLEHAEQLELGYQPFRDDFEVEHDNDAEKLVSSMEINEDEDEVEKALKMSHIDMYNRRLKERDRRKRIAKTHKLIAGKQRINALKRKHTKEERELRIRYRHFARLMEVEEYEKLVTSMKKEQQLRQQIKELKQYRKNGITKLKDCDDFDKLKKEYLEKDDNDQVFFEESVDPDLIIPSGVALLNSSERKMCSSISMKPKQYLAMKTDLLKNAALKKSGYSAKTKLPKHLNSEQKSKLNQYFSRVGWLG